MDSGPATNPSSLRGAGRNLLLRGGGPIRRQEAVRPQGAIRHPGVGRGPNLRPARHQGGSPSRRLRPAGCPSHPRSCQKNRPMAVPGHLRT
jgi:hypothetical protein